MNKNAPTEAEALKDTDTLKCTKPATKEHSIYNALLNGSLNRFEAEQLGDHALNTTISILRAKGIPIASRPEKVPTRFGRKVRVLRYFIQKTPRTAPEQPQIPNFAQMVHEARRERDTS